METQFEQGTPHTANTPIPEGKVTTAIEQVTARVMKERPIVYLYHRKWLWAYNPKLQGVRNVPDGLLRVSNLKMQ